MNKNKKNNNKVYKYIIIGGGPAGCQLAYYFQQNNEDYILLEKDNVPGAFFKKHPRHGQLISINKVYTGIDNPETNMRWDWNSLLTNDYSLLFKNYSKEYYPRTTDLLNYLKDFVNKYNINLKTKQNIVKISKDKNSNIFTIQTDKNKIYCAQKLIVATGLSKAYIPDIKGIELVTQYDDLDTNKKSLINKRVLIIGKGNSGFETANHLVDTASLIHILSPEPLKFAYNTRYPGHLRSINAVFMDTYLLKSQNGILNAKIINIKKYKQGFNVTIAYNNANDEVETIYYDKVISCTGFRFNYDIYDKSCMPDLIIDNRFPRIKTNYESTNISNLFFTGNISQSLDFKKKQSAFIHGFRYNAAFLARYLDAIDNNKSLIQEKIKLNDNLLTKHIINLINTNSAMWQQTGYISCAYVYNPKTSNVEFIPDCPTAYIRDTNYLKNKIYLIVYLDFGDIIKDPRFDALTHNRVHKHNHKAAYDSSVIHPIIKVYSNDEKIAEHHIIEDFENEWLEEEHIKPLEKFIGQVINYINNKSNTNKKIYDLSGVSDAANNISAK